MRWAQLFADLEAQASALEAAQRSGEVTERARVEASRLGLAERLRVAEGPVLLRCQGGSTVRGVAARQGAGWLLLTDEAGADCLVRVAAVGVITGLARWTASASTDAVSSRLGLGHALRAVATDRSVVRVVLVDGTTIDGTLDRVGADFADVAVHAAGELRRTADVRTVATVPFSAIALVRRA